MDPQIFYILQDPCHLRPKTKSIILYNEDAIENHRHEGQTKLCRIGPYTRQIVLDPCRRDDQLRKREERTHEILRISLCTMCYLC